MPTQAEMLLAIKELANKLTWWPETIDLLTGRDEVPAFVRAIEGHLRLVVQRRELPLPRLNLDNKTVAVYSDYGGEADDSNFRTFSLLLCAHNQTGVFQTAMVDIRREHHLDEPLKEIAFKDLGYGPLDRALSSYLQALDNLVPGFLLTVVVDKTIKSVFGTGGAAQNQLATLLQTSELGSWKPAIAEKLLRVLHSLSYLVALLASEGQNVCWMTDEDAIVANASKTASTGTLLGRLISQYSPKQFGQISYATPFSPRDAATSNLLSAPDLAAGALEHYFTRSGPGGPVSNGANTILRWLARDGVCLRKHTIIIKPGPTSGSFIAANLDIGIIGGPESDGAVAVDRSPSAVR